MKVRIKLTEYDNGLITAYVQVKNHWYSFWETLSETGRSAEKTYYQLRLQYFLSDTLAPKFGTYAFAKEHARQVVQQELEDRKPKVLRTMYTEEEGC